MARPKKPKYEYVEKLNLFRKRVKDISGKYVAVYGRTPDELTEKIMVFQEQQALGAENRDDPFFNDYAQRWMDLHGANLTFGGRTDYQSCIDCNIKPHMQGKRIKEVHPDDIKELMLGVAGKSESIYNKTYMLIKQILASACENGLIATNPCPAPHKGGIPAKERQALTKEQATILLDAVKDTKAYLFCMIGLYAGLRREEILGLKWDCVHLEVTPCIEVQRALRFEHNRPVVSDRLKTKASRRIVPIPPQLVKALKEEKAVSNSEFVIRNSEDGPISGTQFKRLWNYVVRRTAKDRIYYRYVDGVKTAHHVEARLGVQAKRGGYTYTIDFEVTPHILRHTYITNLLMAGVDVKTVQYLAGHERAKITLDIYAHLTYNRPEEILGKVNSAFAEG